MPSGRNDSALKVHGCDASTTSHSDVVTVGLVEVEELNVDQEARSTLLDHDLC